MNKNLNVIANELFDKIRTQFPKVKLGDENSKVTSNPEEARFFDFDYVQNNKPLGTISVSISEPDGLVVIYSSDIVGTQNPYVKKQFFNFLKELREFAKQHLLTFDTRDIVKTNLEKRDYKFLSKTQFGESNMSESKLFGTSKTSYQKIGEATIIVKHKDHINPENPASRAQRIESIYVENADGERFKYPFKHLNGARALAQHVSHGGNPYDAIGQHVVGLSEELNKLRMFKHYVDRNPVVSESMSSVTSKVMERIDSVKKEIQHLQNKTRYQEFAESFVEPTSKEIPEEIMNDWIDRLTIRTFNEELKNVFPYIFRLVDESDIPVKELTGDDFVSEQMEEEDCGCDQEIPELAQYEQHLNSIVEGGSALFGANNEDLVAQLNQVIAAPIPAGADGTNAIESLESIIGDPELMDVFKEFADINPEADVREILQDYIKIKDEEHGTDVLSQLTFGDSGEQAAEEPAPTEPAPAAMPPAELPAAAPAAAPAAPQPQMASIDHKGNKMAETIRRAVKAGMKLEDTFTVGSRVMTLQDAIERAGLQVENFFHDKHAAMQNELVEFVKSMYNTEEGSFPKGETGVIIACQKRFGEGCTEMAKHVIGQLHQVNEMQRMRKLAGLG